MESDRGPGQGVWGLCLQDRTAQDWLERVPGSAGRVGGEPARNEMEEGAPG